MKTIFAFIIVSLFCGQLSIAQWTDHLNYRNCNYGGQIKDCYFAVCESGIFTYNPETYEIQKFSKINGLSGIGISCAVVSGNNIVIGYTDGNIDILNIETNRVTNIPEFKNKKISNELTINSIFVFQNRAYCATDCGLLEINISKAEITGLYPLQSDGYLSIYAVTVIDNYIYAATKNGIYKAPVSGEILEYYGTWTKVGTDESSYCDIVEFNGKAIAAQGTKGEKNIIKVIDNSDVKELNTIESYRSMSSDGETLTIASTTTIYNYDNKFNLYNTLSGKYSIDGKAINTNIRTAKLNSDRTTLVISDYTNGLIICDLKGNGIDICPNGPTTNSCQKIIATRNGVYTTAGKLNQYYNNTNTPIVVNYYNGNKWIGSKANTGHDAMNICYDKNATDSIYFSTWGNGIFKVENGAIAQQYTALNSGLQDIFGGTSYTRVFAIGYDNNHNLIMSNQRVSPGIVAKEPNGEWHSLSYKPTNGTMVMSDIICTKDGNMWAINAGWESDKGLFVFNTNNTIDDDSDDMYRSVISTDNDNDGRNAGELKIWDENREVLTDKIYAIAEDKDGQIWLGTDIGVITMVAPQKIFTTQYPVFNKIKVPRNDGTNAADYLLAGQNITAIAIDGANRKWIGTDNSGVYLVSQDGLKTIHKFNTSNSPLLSNNVISIAIHPTNGEVYFGTDCGIVSYLGDATEPEEKLSDIRIYPNPVRSNFNDKVRITGLVDEATIKITDVSGHLVYEGVALGGMSTWDMTKLNGERVSSGVYVVFAANKDGKETAVGKILVVR